MCGEVRAMIYMFRRVVLQYVKVLRIHTSFLSLVLRVLLVADRLVCHGNHASCGHVPLLHVSAQDTRRERPTCASPLHN